MDRYHRKNWDVGSGDVKLPSEGKISVVKEEVDPAYDEYLFLLQQKNRLIKKLQQKDEKQIEIEKREQGFALYLNGANTGSRAQPQTSRNYPSKTPRAGVKTPYSSRKPKTAGDLPRVAKPQHFNYMDYDNDPPDSSRARTAPSKVQRKNWQKGSIEIKTNQGPKRKIHAPVKNDPAYEYSEDFETVDSLEVDDGIQSETSDFDDFDDSDREEDNFVMMSINDVKKLRQSLELNCDIHDSIAKYRNQRHGMHQSPLMEDEEIEEDIDMVDSLEVESGNKFAPDDLIVLELAKPKDFREERPSSNRTKRKEDEKYSVLQSNTSKSSKGNKQNVKLTAHPRRLPETEIDVDTNALVAAMKAENEAVQRRSSTPSKTDSQVDKSTESLNSTLTEDRLDTIVKRIASMDSRAQHRLLETLTVLEESSNPISKTADKPKTSNTEVIFEISSNWGHGSRVGLTEIQFFDAKSKKIPIDDNDTRVVSARQEKGDVCNVTNGKCKTTKERHMWSCNLPYNQSVQLIFQLPCDPQELTRISVWNYNKSASDLNMGARYVCVRVNGEELWGGEIEKGCANQVFDYSYQIQLGSDILPDKPFHKVEQDNVAVVDQRSETPVRAEKEMPAISKQVEASTTRRKKPATPRKDKKESVVEMFGGKKTPQAKKEKRSKTPRSRTPRKMAAQMSINQSSDSTSTSDSIHSSSESIPKESQSLDIAPLKPTKTVTVAASPDEPSMLQQLMQMRGKSGTPKSRADKPSWLQSKDKETDISADFKSLDLSSILKEPSTGKEERPSSRRSVHQEDEWSHGLKFPKQQQQKLSEQGESSLTMRAKWRQNQDLSLEESWSSLSFFNKSQRGRLSANMNLNVQGDALDKYIAQSKAKPAIPEEVEEESQSDEDSDFEIPELPFGDHIDINIKSTWGDKNYVGLNGIEIFQSSGEPIKVTQITADPADINVLEEYSSDPRVVTNLIDGVNRTKDDVHMWLAPFTPGCDHMIYITLEQPVRIAMIRIWNYNKSRIHSFRGAKDVEIILNGRCIFKGEIARATGGIIGQTDTFGDTILFTTDDDILEVMSQYDETYEGDELFSARTQDIERPPTADEDDVRPYTSAAVPIKQTHQTQTPAEEVIPTNASGTLIGQYLRLDFSATWGDPHYLGLTGLEVLDDAGEIIDIDLDQIDAHPRDLNDLPDYNNDERTLDKLIDGENVTMTDQHMWLIPFLEGDEHYICIDLGKPTKVSGLRVWNYNKSTEDTYRGAKLVHVTLDNHIVSPPEGFLIRKDLETASLTSPRSWPLRVATVRAVVMATR
ncbi:protein KATNIP homolog isoform X2 [Ptychodera flava]|uniref:protein KATNIP homolog isoform X2 n=1 Tax=Ptychodera flava TaxID=63121 RepID=UPI00396A309B